LSGFVALDLETFAAQLLERVETVAARKQEPQGSPWLNVKSAADYLGLSEDAVRALIARKELEVFKPNSRVFIHRDACDRWVTSGAAG
jgi:excisionase family DNA binding protein